MKKPGLYNVLALILLVVGCTANKGNYLTTSVDTFEKSGNTRSSGNSSILDGMFPKPGEWPSFRRTGTLEAHSPLQGNISRPAIMWTKFVGGLESLMVVEPSNHKTVLSLPGKEVASVVSDSITLSDFIPIPKTGDEDNGSPLFTFADVFADYPGEEKFEFESGFKKATINGQWAPCVGRCLALKNGEWVQVWETAPFDMLFQPLPLAGDFDGDGAQEVAVLPFHELVLVDAHTGKIKDRCRFNDNRSYGFFGVYDFDGDGKSEFLVQADFSKHVDVLGFRNGKLTLLWQRVIEADISNPQKVLRVGPNPVSDLDGDGRSEVTISIFNDTGDGLWHLTIHDGITGDLKADFPNEMLSSVQDIDGDDVTELLTTCTRGAGILDKIRVRSLKTNKSSILWEQDNIAWQTWEPPLPANVKSIATFGQRTVLSQVRDKQTYVVLQSRSSMQTTLSLAKWDGSSFKPTTTITGLNLEGLGFDATGRLLVRSRHPFGETSSVVIENGNVKRQTTSQIGCSIGPVIVAWPDEANEATIAVQGVEEELVTFQPPKTADGKVELNRIRGRGQSTRWPSTLGPVMADLTGDGRRQLILADAGPSGSARLVAKDLSGAVLWQHEFPRIPGARLDWNTGGIILWQVGHFTDSHRQDVLVTIRRSMMHSEETVLLSGKDGRELWHRDRQISHRGVGGTSFAIADYDADGLDDVASLWPSILYLLKGSTGLDILAMDAIWKEVPAKPVYFGIPAAGNFLNQGSPALFFGGRSMTGVVRVDGSLAWFDALDKSPQYLPSFGDFDGDGRYDVMATGYEDGVRCYDMASGEVKWRMPNPAEGFGSFGTHSENPVQGTASADLDSDGRDEALVVIGQTLFCLGTTPDGSAGKLQWKFEFPTQIGPPTVATLDGEGGVSILVIGSDGYVYCLR